MKTDVRQVQKPQIHWMHYLVALETSTQHTYNNNNISLSLSIVFFIGNKFHIIEQNRSVEVPFIISAKQKIICGHNSQHQKYVDRNKLNRDMIGNEFLWRSRWYLMQARWLTFIYICAQISHWEFFMMLLSDVIIMKRGRIKCRWEMKILKYSRNYNNGRRKQLGKCVYVFNINKQLTMQ